MSDYISVPVDRLEAQALQGLLEEYASRDGTDYGERELTLEEKVGNLHRQLLTGELSLLYHAPSQEWDLMPAEQAVALLQQDE